MTDIYEIVIPGYRAQKETLLSLDKENQEKYCERCYDMTSFPAYMCRDCGLHVPQENVVWCIECEYYSMGGFVGKCSKKGSYPASGWRCTDGKVRPSETSTKVEE
jgi:ribosomal protein L40E